MPLSIIGSRFAFFAALALACAPLFVSAETMHSAQYQIDAASFGGGGSAQLSSETYSQSGTLGEVLIGNAGLSTDHRANAGFGEIVAQGARDNTPGAPNPGSPGGSGGGGSASSPTGGGGIMDSSYIGGPTHIHATNTPLILPTPVYSGTLLQTFPEEHAVFVSVPQEIVSGQVAIIVTRDVVRAPTTAPPDTSLVSGDIFRILAFDQNGAPVAVLAQPVAVEITVPDMPERQDRIGVYALDEHAQLWRIVPDAVVTQTGVRMSTTHPADIAIFHIDGLPPFLSAAAAALGFDGLPETLLATAASARGASGQASRQEGGRRGLAQVSGSGSVSDAERVTDAFGWESEVRDSEPAYATSTDNNRISALPLWLLVAFAFAFFWWFFVLRRRKGDDHDEHKHEHDKHEYEHDEHVHGHEHEHSART